MAIDRTVRRAQTISPFGVGAIYDLGTESFVGMDANKWRVHGDPELRLPRLEATLNVNGFRGAPVTGDAMFSGGDGVPYYRFPMWLFCPICRSMVKWKAKDESLGKQPQCPYCTKKTFLVPMRFMAVCRSGHLMDVPWDRWAHFGKERKDEHKACPKPWDKLEFKSDPKRGAGLQSLVVSCRQCGASNDLQHLPHKDSLKPLFKCTGKHPWQSAGLATACNQVPQVVQRGASNAYYPVVVSAIDIRAGEDSEDDLVEMIKVHAKWQPTLDASKHFSVDNGFVQSYIKAMLEDQTLSQSGVTKEKIEECLNSAQSGDSEPEQQPGSGDDLFLDEWEAFIQPPAKDRSGNFSAEVVDLEAFADRLPSTEQSTWSEFGRLISQVTLARKLRIVKALKGFNRLEPDAERILPPTLGVKPPWLPAIEIFGEGIFIALDEEAVAAWERRIPETHLKTMVFNKERSGLAFLPDVSPRFVLLHTLAHLLMRQLCFECGYSSSSLAERIYSDTEQGMAGLLIYTASADSEGALGGLVREGLPDRLFGTLKSALFRANWCSNDPICSEMTQQGIRGLNKAACHACALVAETSCEHANSLLDRGLVLGNVEAPSIGYFRHFVEKIEGSL